MRKHLVSIPNSLHKKNCIDEMDEILNQISEFKQLVKTTRDSTDPAFIQEYRLFKQHIEWLSEDLKTSGKLYDPSDAS